WEEDRVIQDIKNVCSDEEQIKTVRQVYTWSVTEGLISDQDTSMKRYKEPLQALEQIEQYKEPSLFILKDFHVFLNTANRQAQYELIRKIRDLVYVLENDPNPKNVIFVSPQFEIPFELEKDIMVIEYGLPTYEDIEHVLDEMIRLNEGNPR